MKNRLERDDRMENNNREKEIQSRIAAIQDLQMESLQILKDQIDTIKYIETEEAELREIEREKMLLRSKN